MSGKFKVIFDGHDLTELFAVTSLIRDGGLNRTNTTISRKNMSGVTWIGTESTLSIIPMDFYMYGDIIYKRRKLSEYLSVNKPSKLVFNDEPDKYYLAIPSDKLDFDDERIEARGQIKWEIPDGVAYSVDELNFDNTQNPNLIEINNPGTESIDLDLEATFTTDCGFLGIQSDDGNTSALFGSVEEVDGYHYDTTVKLFDDHFNQDRGWSLNNGITPPVTAIRDQVGTVSYQVDPWQPEPIDPNEGYVKPTNYGTGTSWHGPSITKNVPADKNGEFPVNWKAEYRADFNTDGKPEHSRQVGHNSVTFSDANGNVIAAIVLEDNNPAKERSDLVFYVEGKRVWHQMDTQNFYVNMRDGKYAFVVEKIGAQITFRAAFFNVTKTFKLSNPDVALREVTWFAAAYKDYPPMTNNLLRALNVRKHNVDNWQDIPNKFGSGDSLKYGANGKNIYCTLNDFQWLQFRDPGSTLITVPPGKSNLFIAFSDFSDPPLVKLVGRAAYV
ncbi:distal tail protein Dit [Enterococcus sp. SMC-9]|uniref:distal tail protein Dit n=1 Tax=Enterococcus sp. SMC-9 TaxID=2862343 RepID=UPI001E43AA53|nr:distal tail protein Dit [Enterococcus sp. SMC-9]MCD1025836.1 phage tail family protein [Enterococcus sp. SMC-9]